MATRSGGRNDDRSSQRNAGGNQRSTGSGSANARGATSSGRTSGSRGSSSGSSASGASGRSSSRSSGAAPTTPRGSSAGQSTTNRTDSSGGIGSATPADREREVRTSREVGGSTSASGSGTSSAGATSAGTTGSGTSTTGASTSGGTSARGGMGTSASDMTGTGAGATARRSTAGQSPRSYPPQVVSGGGSTPFAMMRRMMDDMDRLFSEFGFVHPGQLASSLLGGELWPSSHTPRSLGAGSSGGSGVASGPSRGQQGLQRSQAGGLQPLQGLWSPQVELFERGNNLVVRADLPGLSRDDVDVEVDEDMLIIRGERRNELEDEQEGYYRSERSYGSFYRAVPLPDNVDPASCNASFKDGVLEVTLPKPQPTMAKAKKIEVR